jgi:hypothetical protein
MKRKRGYGEPRRNRTFNLPEKGSGTDIRQLRRKRAECRCLTRPI